MRVWSLHPALLDRSGLVSAWREGLLAQAVLRGATKGYRNHPQLERFQVLAEPVPAIAAYLHTMADEADRRGYRFDRSRLLLPRDDSLGMEVTQGQLDYEFDHLRAKVAEREPEWLPRLDAPRPHPYFTVVPGPIASWERPSQRPSPPSPRRRAASSPPTP